MQVNDTEQPEFIVHPPPDVNVFPSQATITHIFKVENEAPIGPPGPLDNSEVQQDGADHLDLTKKLPSKKKKRPVSAKESRPRGKPISLEMRQAVVALRNTPPGPDHVPLTVRQIANSVGISIRSVQVINARYNATGSANPPVRKKQGRKKRMTQEKTDALKAIVEAKNTLYLKEAAEELAARYGKDGVFSLSTISRTMKFDLSLSKKKVLSTKATNDSDNTVERLVFQQDMKQFHRKQICFVAEMGFAEHDTTTTTTGRTRGWAWASRTAEEAVGSSVRTFQGDCKLSVAAALCADGIFAHKSVNSAFDAELFLSFITTNVLPVMNRYPRDRSVLVMDNQVVHQDSRIADACVEAGVILKFLPPYSPDLDPIELAFSKFKNVLQSIGEKVKDTGSSIDVALEHINIDDALGYLRHCVTELAQEEEGEEEMDE